MSNKWVKLWKIAADTIIVPTEDENYVILRYDDDSEGGWFWYENDWQPCATLNICPCDVAARDSL